MFELSNRGRSSRVTYLWVLQAINVRVQVEFDSRICTRQRHATNQQHDEHDKRECGSDVDHLRDHNTIRQETRLISFGLYDSSEDQATLQMTCFTSDKDVNLLLGE